MLGASNLVNGTQLTLTNGTGTPIPSAQTVIAGSNGGTQTFTFSNGVTFTLNTPTGDTASGIAAGMNGKVISVANNPVGTMAFVAGKNIDGLQRDQQRVEPGIDEGRGADRKAEHEAAGDRQLLLHASREFPGE